MLLSLQMCKNLKTHDAFSIFAEWDLVLHGSLNGTYVSYGVKTGFLSRQRTAVLPLRERRKPTDKVRLRNVPVSPISHVGCRVVWVSDLSIVH